MIKSVSINKFRGFKNVSFDLGNAITVIAGQNGTQKTTLLGILSQPFSITDKNNPIHGERPLSGGSFRSAFAEKFKLSEKFDTIKNHEWTLHFHDRDDFTVESIKRSDTTSHLRFWQKGTRDKGSGYIQMPVVFLSLSRLFPIGEDQDINSSEVETITGEEFKFYNRWHNKILIIPNVDLESASYLTSKQKNTLGANTSFYDWKQNSAGQDNIGKILLAVMSFKRLKDKYNDYEGGILVIDEIDATLYPASQIELLKALRRFSSDYKLQIILTTHSLTILEEACKYSLDTRLGNQVKVIYLERKDEHIIARENLHYDAIARRLNIATGKAKISKKLTCFCEDEEAEIFLKAILKNKRACKVKIIKQNLGCQNLISLTKQKVPAFSFPESLIILDADVDKRKISNIKNILLLPGNQSPERILAKFLYELRDSDTLWDDLTEDYSKQVVFRNYPFNEIMSDREIAKKWFSSQRDYWGRGCAKLINAWIIENHEMVEEFRVTYDRKLEEFEKQLGSTLG